MEVEKIFLSKKTIHMSKKINLSQRVQHLWAFQVSLVVKNPTANAGDIRDGDLFPVCGWSPGGGYGSPLQYSCLENPMDRGAWQTTVHRVTQSQTQLKWLSMHANTESPKLETRGPNNRFRIIEVSDDPFLFQLKNSLEIVSNYILFQIKSILK